MQVGADVFPAEGVKMRPYQLQNVFLKRQDADRSG